MARIFISYRRGDAPESAGRIYDHLVRRFGKEDVFMDVDAIPMGVDFRDHVHRALSYCRMMLVVIGPQWLTGRLDEEGDFVRIEIESGLQRDVVVIPVLVQDASMPDKSQLPPSLGEFAYRNAARVRPLHDFENDIKGLIQHLELLLGAEHPAPPVSAAPPRSPRCPRLQRPGRRSSRRRFRTS